MIFLKEDLLRSKLVYESHVGKLTVQEYLNLFTTHFKGSVYTNLFE